MSNLVIQKGNLFENYKEGEYLAHAVNCQAVWGSGIAVEFRKRFPKSYEEYQDDCDSFYVPSVIPGEFLITDENVICLYTSDNYGEDKDSEKDILEATRISVKYTLDFITCDCVTAHPMKEIVINSPKINAGKFEVPWEKTEAVLKEVLKDYPQVTWKVWELE